ncbi:MAG: DUF3253 domain-containing protein [Actinomycetota bacterium]|nr:DUF3253 domain-containing protein [Actinomycetota bacterium]
MPPHDLSDAAAALEHAVRELLARRAPRASICPSEAARVAGGDDWRQLMPLARTVAARLAADGEVEVTQRGVVVDAVSARGPIRIRRGGGPPGGAQRSSSSSS